MSWDKCNKIIYDKCLFLVDICRKFKFVVNLRMKLILIKILKIVLFRLEGQVGLNRNENKEPSILMTFPPLRSRLTDEQRHLL